MQNSIGRIGKSLFAGALATLAVACVTPTAAPLPESLAFKTLDQIDPDTIPTFADEAEIDAYIAAQQRERDYADAQRRAYFEEQRRQRELERERLRAENAKRIAELEPEVDAHQARIRALRSQMRGLEGDAREAVAEEIRKESIAMRPKMRELRLLQEPPDELQESPMALMVTATGATEDVAITNNQVAGVDEGGIVKATREFLVILRRGKVHVVRHGDDTLEKVASIDAFPPGDDNPADTWYDEMLLQEGMVVVIGYSYGEDGTEISRFELSDEGQLTYRDTHYLSSSDYYSSSNYASRMIEGTFYTYTPTYFAKNWREEMPFLERRLPDGTRQRVGTTLEPTNMGMTAALMLEPAPYADMMHGITACDVLEEELTCTTRTVLATDSSEYYFAQDAAYIWAGMGHNERWGRASRDWGSVLYRIPFDFDEGATAISVQGAPVDQFSFHQDEETESLFVLTVGDFVFENSGSFGLQMWESEIAFGETALLRIPLEEMSNGAKDLPQALYRSLPEMDGRVQNRFVGRHLMFGTGSYWRYRREQPAFYVTPLDAPWVQRLELPHSVTRLDRLGSDGVAIGEGEGDALGFTAVELSEDTLSAKLGSTYFLPAAEEGENRSQAFFWRADPDGEDGDGLMALPVNKAIEGHDLVYLGSATSMFYLQRKAGELEPVGELGTYPDDSVIAAAQAMEAQEDEGDCLASCVDWYGNSRPIFIGERIFALMGDEILEGEVEAGKMREVRRINFGG